MERAAYILRRVSDKGPTFNQGISLLHDLYTSKNTISTPAFPPSNAISCHPTYIRLDPSLWTTHPAACVARVCGQPTILYSFHQARSFVSQYVDALYDVRWILGE